MPAQNETTLRPPSNAARTLYEVFQNELLPIQYYENIISGDPMLYLPT